MTAILDLTDVEIDRSLLKRVPLGLCQYYQALPLAREQNCVSVAMVYPHNTVACAVLADLLAAQVVPVESSAAAIQSAIDKLGAPTPPDQPGVLVHAPGAGPSALLMKLATILAAEQATSYARLESSEVDFAAVLVAAGAYRLTALPLPLADEAARLILRSTTSLLLAPTTPEPLDCVVTVLRGFAGDLLAVSWAAAIASSENAALILLVLTEPLRYDLREIISPESNQGRHLANCIRAAAAKGVEPVLRIRQGSVQQQIVAEITARQNLFLALPAEGHGNFAAGVVENTLRSSEQIRGVLVCKPDRIAVSSNKPFQSTKRRIHRE